MQKCDKIIGLTGLDFEVKQAEEISNLNNIYNASFILCKPSEVQQKSAPLLKKCISVALLRQDSSFGNSNNLFILYFILSLSS